MGGGEFVQRLNARQDAAEFPMGVMTGHVSLVQQGIPNVVEVVLKANFDALIRVLEQYG